MFKELDPLLHSQLRLAIISVLVSVKEAEFAYLREKTGATSGNLSVQLSKLSDAGYVSITKSFRDNYPLTTCRVSETGIRAFEKYVDAIRTYLKK